MEVVMNQGDVLELFMEEANKLDKTHIRKNDTILLLAQLVADSREQLSKESFDALVHIGATIYKTSRREARARSEIATTMRGSIEKEKNT
jgi:hypothetical protein